MGEAGAEDLAVRRDRLMEALRAFGGVSDEFGRRFAAWLGLHATDAVALLEIYSAEARGLPLSPARLSERIPLSSGATTALLNRLEQAGHIVRTREHADRRVVTLRSSAESQRRADEFFGPLAGHLDAVVTAYPPELLARFEDFVGDLRGAMEDFLTGHEREGAEWPPERAG